MSALALAATDTLETLRRPRNQRRAVQLVVLVGAALFVLPAILSTFWVQIATAAAIYSVAALGLNMLYGKVGLVSLGQIALLAIGTWVAARLGYATDLPYPIVLFIAGIVTAAFGVLIGLPALRLRGLYLGLITLMGAGGITVILNKLKFPNGGGGFRGIVLDLTQVPMDRPSLAVGDTAYFRYSVVFMVLMFLLVLWHVSAKPGRAWAAIRESESAALSAGINVTLYKLWAFALAAFVTGVAGGLLAALVRLPQVTAFGAQESLILFAVVLMGGAYSLWGAVVAGLLMRVVPAVLSYNGVSDKLGLILFGVGITQVLLTSPGGIAGDLGGLITKLGGLTRRLVGREATVGVSS